MQWKVKSKQEFWSGVLFLGIGTLALVMSRNYFMGNSVRMGPGYFPTLVGIALSILGAIITLTSLKVEGEEIKAFGWRAIVMVTLGFFLFGWGIDRVGFVLSMGAMIVCSMLAGREFKVREAVIMCVVLISGSVALFIYGLKLPFSIFWWR
jgi:hypothetical protein